MKKAAALLLFIMVSISMGQIYDNVPTDHWLYESITKLQVAGHFTELDPSIRPYPKQLIIDALMREDFSDLDQSSGLFAEYQRLRDYFTDEINFMNENTNTESMAGLDFTGFYNIENQEAFTAHGRGAGFISLNNHFIVKYSMVFDRGMYEDADYIGDEWAGWAGYQEQVYLAWCSPNAEFKFGRDFVKWGFGKGGNLLISDNSRPYDLVSVKVHSKKISLQAFVSQLNMMSNARRYMSAAKLEFRPTGNLIISAGQAGLYGGEDCEFDFALSNPFSVAYITQHNDPGNLNSMIYLDGAWRFLSKYRVYGEFLIDDFQIDHEVVGDLEPNELGVIIGLEAVDFWYGLDGWLELTQIRNRTYNTISDYEKWLHRNIPIAHPLGTDFQSLELQLERWLLPVLKVNTNYQMVRKGEGTIKGTFTTPWNDEGVTMATGYDEKIPYGTIETTNRFTVGCNYFPLKNISADLALGFETISNLNHVTGKSRSGFIMTLSLWGNLTTITDFKSIF